MRGQILARQLMVLLSWALLIAVIIIAFVLQSFDNQKAAPLEASLAPARDAVLNAYLRQTTDYRGELIPFAEYVQIAIASNDDGMKEQVKKITGSFLRLLPQYEKHRIGVYLPGNRQWIDCVEDFAVPIAEAEQKGLNCVALTKLQDDNQARTEFLLPDGTKIEVDYARETK